MEEKVQRLRSTNWYVQNNRQGDIKNSIGNGIAKEHICMTHGHELRDGGLRVNEGCWVEGAKREKLGQL